MSGLTGLRHPAAYAGGGEGSADARPAAGSDRKALPRILCRVRPPTGARRAARQPLRRATGRSATTAGAAAARHREPEGRRGEGKGARRVSAGGGAGQRPARRQERVLRGRGGDTCSRSPTRCTRSTTPSSMPASTVQVDDAFLPYHVREDGAADDATANTANGRSCASRRSTTRCAASRRSARAITSAGEAGTARTPSTCR